MLALIMAGGRGERLGMGEKGLVRLCEQPLIEYVLKAAEDAGLDPVVVTTPRTPYTANYCRVRGIEQICTKGAGYIEDLIEAVTVLEETGPVLIICADLPGITASHLHDILTAYESGICPACSTWIPARLLKEQGCETRFISDIHGVRAVPAGINILLGSRIGEEQEETRVLLEDPALAFNVNTRPELTIARVYFSAGCHDKNPEAG